MNNNTAQTSYNDMVGTVSLDFLPTGVSLETYLRKNWLSEKYKIVWIEISYGTSWTFSLYVFLVDSVSPDSVIRIKTDIGKKFFEWELLRSVNMKLSLKDEDLSRYKIHNTSSSVDKI